MRTDRLSIRLFKPEDNGTRSLKCKVKPVNPGFCIQGEISFISEVRKKKMDEGILNLPYPKQVAPVLTYCLTNSAPGPFFFFFLQILSTLVIISGVMSDGRNYISWGEIELLS